MTLTDNAQRVPEILLTRRQAADRLGCHIRSIDYYLNVRKLTRYKDGRNRVGIDPAELDRLERFTPAVISADHS